MKRYETVKRMVWKHEDGRTASAGGCCPDWDHTGWAIVQEGWTVRDHNTNTTGLYGAVKVGMEKVAVDRLTDEVNAKYHKLYGGCKNK